MQPRFPPFDIFFPPSLGECSTILILILILILIFILILIPVQGLHAFILFFQSFILLKYFKVTSPREKQQDNKK